MSRRPDPRQLSLAGLERTAPPSRPAASPETDPWAGVRLDVLVQRLVDERRYSARALARSLGCSPSTVARLRTGRVPRTVLRNRLIRIAWRELDPDACADARLPARPADNVRWHAGRRFEAAHAFEREPAGPEVASLCGYRTARTVSAHWPATPDGFAALCPSCLALCRQILLAAANTRGP